MCSRIQFVFLWFCALLVTPLGKPDIVCFEGCRILDQVLSCSSLTNIDLPNLAKCVDRNAVLIVDVRSHGLDCTCKFLNLAKRVSIERESVLFHDTICLTKRIKRCGAIPRTQYMSTGHTPIYTLIGGRIFDVASPDFEKQLTAMDNEQTKIISALKSAKMWRKFKLAQEDVIDKALLVSYSVSDQDVEPKTDPEPEHTEALQAVNDPSEPTQKKQSYTTVEEEVFIFIVFHVLIMSVLIIILIAKSLNENKKQANKQSSQGMGKNQPRSGPSIQDRNLNSYSGPQRSIIKGSEKICNTLSNAIAKMKEHSKGEFGEQDNNVNNMKKPSESQIHQENNGFDETNNQSKYKIRNEKGNAILKMTDRSKYQTGEQSNTNDETKYQSEIQICEQEGNAFNETKHRSQIQISEEKESSVNETKHQSEYEIRDVKGNAISEMNERSNYQIGRKKYKVTDKTQILFDAIAKLKEQSKEEKKPKNMPKIHVSRKKANSIKEMIEHSKYELAEKTSFIRKMKEMSKGHVARKKSHPFN